MKKLLFLALALVVLLPAGALAQDQEQPQEQQERRYTMYGVMFYNLENLFDTINNNGVYDLEFSPRGARQWNGIKYWQKQHNMAYAITEGRQSFANRHLTRNQRVFFCLPWHRRRGWRVVLH